MCKGLWSPLLCETLERGGEATSAQWSVDISHLPPHITPRSILHIHGFYYTSRATIKDTCPKMWTQRSVTIDLSPESAAFVIG
jgi:hypothetical protein